MQKLIRVSIPVYEKLIEQKAKLMERKKEHVTFDAVLALALSKFETE